MVQSGDTNAEAATLSHFSQFCAMCLDSGIRAKQPIIAVGRSMTGQEIPRLVAERQGGSGFIQLKA